MSIGPLRRSVGALGLVALIPVAAMLVVGTLHPVEAAQRAVVTLAALLVLGRLASWGVDGMASSLERASGDGPADRRSDERRQEP